MNIKSLAFASLLVMGTLGSSAYAVTAQSGIYIGANTGWSFAEAANASTVGATGSSNKNYVLGATIGYDYAFTQNWLAGLEAGYVYFGKTTYTNGPASGLNGSSGSFTNTGVQLLLTGTYLNQNGFNVFGKVGAIDEDTSAGGTALLNQNTQVTGSAVDIIPAAAIGVGYMPVQNLNIALQYEHTFGDNYNASNNSGSKPMSQNALTLGVTYKFGTAAQ